MHDNELALLAHLDAQTQILAEIRDAIVAPYGEVTEFRKPAWAAGSFADLDLHNTYAGVWVYNPNAFDIYLGFGPGAGTALRCEFPIGAGGALAIPFRCSLVSVGAAAAGSCVVGPLATPNMAGGGLR